MSVLRSTVMQVVKAYVLAISGTSLNCVVCEVHAMGKVHVLVEARMEDVVEDVLAK